MNISVRNEKILYISELFSGMIFLMPVWVAYELQYISLAQIAIIEATIQGSQLLSELPTGAIADLLGKKASVLIGRVLRIVGLYLYVTSTSFWSFVLYAVVYGIGDSFMSGAHDALIYDSLKQGKREHLYAKINSKGSLIFQLSFALAILGGGLLSLWGYQAAIYATMLAQVAALITNLWFIEPWVDTQKFTLRRYILQLKKGFGELFKSSYVRDISLFYIAVGGITWSAMMIYNTSLLTTIGFSTFEIGIIVAVIRLTNSGALFGALNLKNFVTKKRVYLLFPLLMILCYLPGLALTKWLSIPAVAISIFVSTSRWVILGAYVNEHYKSKNRATAISTLSMLVSLSVVGFALLSSPVMAYFGGVRAMFTVLGAFSLLLVLPLGLRIQRRYHPVSTP